MIEVAYTPDMWKKRHEFRSRIDFEHTGNPDESWARYSFASSPEEGKILEIDWVSLSGGLGSGRSYLSHLAELILKTKPKKITWEVYKDDAANHEKLFSLYDSLTDSQDWPGIGFSRAADSIATSYSIGKPQIFAELIRRKLRRQ